jgi:RNA polymerase sigma-70 factor (ECF subfamily)
MAIAPRFLWRLAGSTGMSLPRTDARAAAREVEFERLYAEFAAPIYTYALRMTGDPDRAADVAQDTFIKAYRRLDTLTDPGAARSWIYRIATNTAIDEMRRRRWTVSLDRDAGAEPHPDPADPAPGPEAQVVGAVVDQRIGKALLRLRPNHRQCLLLSDLEGMDAREIGEVLGMSHGAVRTLLCRARGEMRRHLAAEGLIR